MADEVGYRRATAGDEPRCVTVATVVAAVTGPCWPRQNAGEPFIVDDLLPAPEDVGRAKEFCTSVAAPSTDMLFDHGACLWPPRRDGNFAPPTEPLIRRPASSNSAWTR